MRWLDSITDSMNTSVRNSGRQRTGRSGVLQSMGLQRVRHGLVTKPQQMVHKEEIMITQLIQGCPRTTSLAYSSSHYDCLYRQNKLV